MMGWNYRLVRRYHVPEDDLSYVMLTEVFYNGDTDESGARAFTSDGMVTLVCDDDTDDVVADIRQQLERQMAALEKPILDERADFGVNKDTAYTGEKCHCGAWAAHKVEEAIMPDDPMPDRHPLTAYICHRHFVELMGPFANSVDYLERKK